MILIATLIIGCVFIFRAIFKRDLRREEQELNASIERQSVGSVSLHTDCPYGTGTPSPPKRQTKNYGQNLEILIENRKFSASGTTGVASAGNDYGSSSDTMPTHQLNYDAHDMELHT